MSKVKLWYLTQFFIYMEKLTFNYCTLPAGKQCKISSMKAALKAFTRMGKKGYVTLERLTMPSGKSQVVWVSRHNGRITAVLPVFADERPIQDAVYCRPELIKSGEMLRCGEYFYQTYLNKDNEMGLRALAVLADEDTVRKACELLDLNVINVELIQMFDATTEEYLSSGWLIKTLGKQIPYTLIYADLRDRAAFDGIDFGNVKYLTVTPERCFSANGTCYQLHKDNVDRLSFTKSPLQVCNS